jgi:hypothetical protein
MVVANCSRLNYQYDSYNSEIAWKGRRKKGKQRLHYSSTTLAHIKGKRGENNSTSHPTMAINEHHSSSSAVLENEDLLSQIILKLGSSIHQIRCSRVSPLWRAVSRGSAFETAFVGFLVEMQEGSGRIVKLSYAKLGEETALFIRARVQEAGVSADAVVGVTNGFILNERQGEGYFFSFPAGVPRVYTRASEVIPSRGGRSV